jgi:uncharacterized membrane protein
MKKYFFAGLVTLLPLAVTVWVALFLLNFLTKPFIGVVTRLIGNLPIPEQLIQTLGQICILAGLFLFIILLGMVARWYFFNALVRLGEKIFARIPLINKIYKTTKDIIHPLFKGDNQSFNQVVMLPFPYHGAYILGLITRDAPQTCSNSQQQDMVSIFLPTTPNPTTGFLILRPKAELIYLDMHPKDAIKYIVSCGVVPPNAQETPS